MQDYLQKEVHKY